MRITNFTLGCIFIISLFGCLPQDKSINENQSSSDKTKVVITEPYPVSLPVLFEKKIVGKDLVLEEVLTDSALYTRYRISYTANDLKISGIMNIPKGEGPFPLLILNHGYIDPAIYTNGRGLKREQNYFANNGYTVLHPDYRNHAYSDKDDELMINFRIGYTEDVIASIYAVKNSTLPELAHVDTDHVGMLGHSMGGGITQNVLTVRPELVKAAVLYAPVSSDARDSLNRYVLSDSSRSDMVEGLFNAHGSPQDNPEFWDNISPRFFFDRVKTPVHIFIGTNDESTPPEWSYTIKDQLEAAGKQVDITIFEGERHEYGFKWQEFMDSSNEFFASYLK